VHAAGVSTHNKLYFKYVNKVTRRSGKKELLGIGETIQKYNQSITRDFLKRELGLQHMT
jgi:hypothetical protein